VKVGFGIAEGFGGLGLDGIVVAELSGLAVGRTDPDLEAIKAEVLDEAAALSDDELADNEILLGYRELVQSVGRSPKKFAPAPERLLEQLRRTASFPTINTAVDSYNVVVARRYLALGVHDVAKLHGDVSFRLSPGGEPFISVGSQKTRHTVEGDYVYADERRVLAWLDSKDSDEVKISDDTTSMIIVIQGNRRTSAEYNARAAEEACELVTRFCGGGYEIARVEPP
jgi:DNA/RNA-binding domain of Phe-tRNA-synthetase-like protein